MDRIIIGTYEICGARAVEGEPAELPRSLRPCIFPAVAGQGVKYVSCADSEFISSVNGHLSASGSAPVDLDKCLFPAAVNLRIQYGSRLAAGTRKERQFPFRQSIGIRTTDDPVFQITQHHATNILVLRQIFLFSISYSSVII